MEFDPQDQDIINLLTKLKGAADEYPKHMLVTRRQAFLKQMTEVGLGIGAAAGVGNALGKTKTSGISRLTSNVVETVLIATILVEASAMAYLYREQLAGFLQTITANSKTEQVPLPSAIPTSLEIQGVGPSPAATSTLLTSATPVTGPAILMVTPTGTAISGNTPEAASPVSAVSATPDPKSNNGNHYGQTPKPERTKENNGNNNKPPKEKEDKPPKEETKPPKDKK